MPEFPPRREDTPTFPLPHIEHTPPSRISDHPEFHSLRRAQRRFGTRATILSAGGFLLYVLLSSFVPAVMNQPLFGHLTIGLTLGLGQFVIMGVTAWCYVRHMRNRVDPLARGLRTRRHENDNRHARSATAPQSAGQPLQHGARGFRTW
ncbi:MULTISPECIES: DUF485 domain-containing protein [Streptomyces]|uniref:DUF485 domain-containing protein n=2 Tax=Streptomyces violaceus TaxID=1936 RepID=A0ABZ1P5H8_STRVL|nr:MULTISPECIES: DUF485 domain-containing protein [Streptomyces]MCT9138072.1 DUF485 domain-containing protein [Streptomyces violarus]WND16581.1 DUF485 domain-containing protein [Streptomyces janthinus]WNF66633.1 DUF485 domain-containing protein [Streptomyces sp. CGMCC 4.1456]GGS44584.1 membrane protein [Streptomyces janthinus]